MSTDDPRLTAYALGELDPPEQAELEALVQSDPEAAREVAEIHQLAALFRTQLATEPALPLTPEQQRQILAVADEPAPLETKVVALPSRRRVWLPVAIAACVAVVAGSSCYLFLRTKISPRTPGALSTAESRDEVEAGVPAGEESAHLSPPSTARAERVATPAPAWPQEPPLIAGNPVGPSGSDALRPESAAQGKASPLEFSGSTREARTPQAAAAAAEVSEVAKSPQDSHVFIRGQKGIAGELVPRHFTDMLSPGKAVATKDGAQIVSGSGANSYTAGTLVNGGTLAPTLGKDMPGSTTPSTYAEQGYVHTRSFEQWKPEIAWDRPVRREAASEVRTATTPAPASIAVGAGQRDGTSPDLVGHTRTLDKAKAQDAALRGRLYASVDEWLMPAKPGESPSNSEPAESTKALPVPATPAIPALRRNKPGNTDSYDSVTDNPFLPVAGNPLSTFSVDVDTASYSNVRRYLNAGQRPPKGAVRIEELINYFHYDYPKPKDGEPFSVSMEVAACPWTPEHRLLRIGLKARELDPETRPQANLVFLIDVSGSMMPQNRLPLVKQSLRLLVDQLGPQDTVAIAVYAGASGTVLEPTNDKEAIRSALDRLQAGGSTNGAAGIRLAYDLAKQRFAKEKTNRVILATDGDFNVGVTNQSDLTDLIKAKAKSGVYLTVLGVGYGNLKDSTMEKLADKGNGNYAYLDSIAEGRKVLVEQMSGTLFTVAKDVKLQLEFNPAQVAAYRLIGYENRLLAKEDFNDDTKDAGEIGAGHMVTALYEVVPAGRAVSGAIELTTVDALKYQPSNVDRAKSKALDTGEAASRADAAAPQARPAEMLTLKLRWKAPDSDVSTKREFPLTDAGLTWEKSSPDFRWAAAVASFGMLLRDSPYKGQASWSSTRELAVEGQGSIANSHRGEFLDLIGKAETLAR